MRRLLAKLRSTLIGPSVNKLTQLQNTDLEHLMLIATTRNQEALEQILEAAIKRIDALNHEVQTLKMQVADYVHTTTLEVKQQLAETSERFDIAERLLQQDTREEHKAD